MSSVKQAVTTVVGGVIGFVTGGPSGALKGAAIGYSIGGSVSQEEPESRTYSLGPFDMTRSHQLPVPVIYGEHLVSGNVIYEDIYGEDDEFMNIQVALTEGPIESISEVKADEIDIPGESLELKLGERSQSAWDENPDSNFPYIAYIAAHLDAEELELTGAPTISAMVKGRKIRVYNNGWTTQYSNNPAYCLLDFLTNKRYGLGLNDEDVDLDSFISVAEWCDNKSFSLNYVIDKQGSALDIIEDMTRSFQSFLIYTGGKIRIKAETGEEETTQHFDMDNIIDESFSFNQKSKKEIPNKVIVDYVEPKENYEMVQAVYSDDLDIRRSNEVRETNITLDGVTDFDQAGKIARVFHAKGKYARNSCQFSAGIDSIHCEPGDIISVTHDVPYWEDKLFRVLEIKEDEDDTMQIAAIEYHPAIYTEKAVAYQSGLAPDFPNPYAKPPSVENLEVTPGGREYQDGTYNSILQLTWDRPGNPFWKAAQVWWTETGLENWVKDTETSGDRHNLALSEGNYDIKVVSVNRNGIRENFDNAAGRTDLTLEGKSSGPSAPTLRNSSYTNEIIIELNTQPEADFRDFEFRLDENWGFDDSNLIARNDSTTLRLGKDWITDLVDNEGENFARDFSIYVRARNNSNKYSDTLTIDMVNSKPNPPQLEAKAFFQAIWVDLLPENDPTIEGYNVYFDDGDTEEKVTLDTVNRITYSASAGDSYDIQTSAYDVIGEGDRSAIYSIEVRKIDDIAEFAQELQPPELVSTLPTLPDDDYPEGALVVLTDAESEDYKKLHKNVSDSWTTDFNVDDLTKFQNVVAATVLAAAIGADEIASNEIIARHVGSNEIITESANIAEAVIDSASIIDVEAGKVTVGGSGSSLSGLLDDDFASQYQQAYQRYQYLLDNPRMMKGINYTWDEIFTENDSWDDVLTTSSHWSTAKLELLWDEYDNAYTNLQNSINDNTASQSDYDDYYQAFDDIFNHMETGNLSTLNEASDLGDMAFEDAVELAKLGKTIVDGGYLQTILISADRIDVDDLAAINANFSGELNGVSGNFSDNLSAQTGQINLTEASEGGAIEIKYEDGSDTIFLGNSDRSSRISSPAGTPTIGMYGEGDNSPLIELLGDTHDSISSVTGTLKLYNSDGIQTLKINGGGINLVAGETGGTIRLYDYEG
ncbi:MAG: phage tail protein, partial [Halanaerobiales bacterium]